MATSVKSSFNHAKDKVFNSCLSSIATLGYSISNSQKDSGIISFETGRSMFTWKGQKLTCTIIEMEPNKTDLIISGVSAGVQLTDWGEAEKIANKVVGQIRSTLN